MPTTYDELDRKYRATLAQLITLQAQLEVAWARCEKVETMYQAKLAEAEKDAAKDLAFLREMKWRLQQAPRDTTQYEMIETMIGDWADELDAAIAQNGKK